MPAAAAQTSTVTIPLNATVTVLGNQVTVHGNRVGDVTGADNR